VDLVSSLKAVVGRFSRLFELRNTSCELITQDGPIIGHWDAFRIEQIIGNLLSNAWKYGDSKPVQVRIDTITPGCCESSQSCCVIRVKDQGPGISDEMQRRIFEGFVRGDGACRQRGTGLGLYICANLVQVMGGTLTLKSKIGEGSEFIVCIPRGLEPSAICS
jgi:signal transduction histidine kinase